MITAVGRRCWHEGGSVVVLKDALSGVEVVTRCGCPQAEVPDLDEARWQDVLQKPADELVDQQSCSEGLT